MTISESLWSRVPVSESDAQSRIRLANLLLRDSEGSIDIVKMANDSPNADHELYVKARIHWRPEGSTEPILPLMPRLLAIIESLRGCQGVPSEIQLDSYEGVATYIPTGRTISSIPPSPRDAVLYLRSLIQSTLEEFKATVKEVEDHFWRIARQRGFSPEIVHRMVRNERGYDSPAFRQRFEQIMQSYFSVKFRVYRAESTLRWEE